MTKNKKRIIATIAIVFIVFSVIAFVMPFHMNVIFWISYLFGAFSIAVQLYVLKIAFDGEKSVKSKLYGFPIARVGFLYMAAQIILSFIFMALAALAPIWLIIVINVLLLAAAAIGFMGADAMKDEIEKQEAKIATDTECIGRLRAMTAYLPKKCQDTEAKEMLENLAEAFFYCDPVSSEALKSKELELEAAVLQLKAAVESGESDEIKKHCMAASLLLEERNIMCKENKGR